MIARYWRGWTAPATADAYAAYYRDDVLPHLQQIDGFRGARLLRRPDGEEIEFVSITHFVSLDAVRAFAGDDYELAVVTTHAQRLLIRFDPRCRHYQIALDSEVP